MASPLQLMRFDPAAALRDDLAAGTRNRLVFYRAIAVDAKDDDERTMLAHAARVGDVDAVRILLERGADPNAQDRNGSTPLMWLARGPGGWRDRPDDVEFAAEALLEAGARIEARDANGRTAAFIAAGQMVLPFFIVLARRDIMLPGRADDRGFTLLHVLCDALEWFSGLPIKEAMDAESDALAIAVLLVERLGVDPNAKSAIGKTAREIAVANKSRLVAPWLAYGAKAFERDDVSQLRLLSGGATACEAAAMRDAVKIRALIELGEAPDEPASDGEHVGLTPLSCAASVMALDVMTLLLDAGADPTARINGKARGGRETEGTSAMRMLLWAPQSSVSILRNLSAADWAKALRAMLRTASAADAPVDAEGLTPLLTLANNIGRGWRAGESNWAELAAGILLETGADPNGRMSAQGIDRPFCKVPGSVTALGLLAMDAGQDAENMARLLLKGGADPNLADKTGTTPLMTAAGLSSPDKADAFVQLLLDAGANVALRDEKGRTALDMASAAGNDGVVEKLLSAMERSEAGHQCDEAENTRSADAGQTAGSGDLPGPASGSSSFFERIRGKHPSGGEQAMGVANDDAALRGKEPHAHPETASGAFFNRMRSRSALRQKPSGEERGRTQAPPRGGARNGDDPFGPVRALADFLGRTLAPLNRGELELRMMALGLLAEGGAEDGDVLARRTADLLISLNMATEVDWKSDGEDFCGLLEGLVNFGSVREAGFESVPIEMDADDDVPALANKFDAVSRQWGWPVKLAALALDADSYVFLLTDSLQLHPARLAAERAGLTLLVPSELK